MSLAGVLTRPMRPRLRQVMSGALVVSFFALWLYCAAYAWYLVETWSLLVAVPVAIVLWFAPFLPLWVGWVLLFPYDYLARWRGLDYPSYDEMIVASQAVPSYDEYRDVVQERTRAYIAARIPLRRAALLVQAGIPAERSRDADVVALDQEQLAVMAALRTASQGR